MHLLKRGNFSENELLEAFLLMVGLDKRSLITFVLQNEINHFAPVIIIRALEVAAATGNLEVFEQLFNAYWWPALEPEAYKVFAKGLEQALYWAMLSKDHRIVNFIMLNSLTNKLVCWGSFNRVLQGAAIAGDVETFKVFYGVLETRLSSDMPAVMSMLENALYWAIQASNIDVAYFIIQVAHRVPILLKRVLKVAAFEQNIMLFKQLYELALHRARTENNYESEFLSILEDVLYDAAMRLNSDIINFVIEHSFYHGEAINLSLVRVTELITRRVNESVGSAEGWLCGQILARLADAASQQDAAYRSYRMQQHMVASAEAQALLMGAFFYTYGSTVRK